VKCWWCCCDFDDQPIGAPTKYNEADDTFEVFGCFCSFPCASAYMRNDGRRLLSERLYLLNMLWRRAHERCESGDDGDCVVPAPPREMLDIFGGPLTTGQFKMASARGKHYRLNIAPQLVPVEVIGEDMSQGRRTGLLQTLKHGPVDGAPESCPPKRKKLSVIDQLIVQVK